MAEQNAFKDQKKLRQAELINPPNTLKQKVGSGGIEMTSLQKAQQMIEKNTTDFVPIARELLNALEASITHARDSVTTGEAAIEEMLHPAVQFKAQGALFHFPLITEVSDTLVNFLETVENVDKDVLEIVIAHKKVIGLIIQSNMTDSNTDQAKALKASLLDACARYYKTKK